MSQSNITKWIILFHDRSGYCVWPVWPVESGGKQAQTCHNVRTLILQGYKPNKQKRKLTCMSPCLLKSVEHCRNEYSRKSIVEHVSWTNSEAFLSSISHHKL